MYLNKSVSKVVVDEVPIHMGVSLALELNRTRLGRPVYLLGQSSDLVVYVDTLTGNDSVIFYQPSTDTCHSVDRSMLCDLIMFIKRNQSPPDLGRLVMDGIALVILNNPVLAKAEGCQKYLTAIAV